MSARSGADSPLRGNGCVAADFDGDGNTDIYVTTAGYNVPTDGYDALLWNDGDGTFTEGAVRPGSTPSDGTPGAAVGDVNGDGLPDLFVAGYTDVNWPIPASACRLPDEPPRRARPPLPESRAPARTADPTFREVGSRAGIEPTRCRARPRAPSSPT